MRIKLCGVRSIQCAQACVAAGATFAGINFIAGANRSVDVPLAASLIAHLGDVTAVGVFRDQPVAQVQAVARELGLSMVQLHGSESPAQCEALAGELRLIKAIDLGQAHDLELLDAYAQTVEMLIVDGRNPGSGVTWDFTQLHLREGRLRAMPVVLAGGLNPLNVAHAITTVRPYGVDCASGIEADAIDGQVHGIDPARALAFCRRARQTHAQLVDISPMAQR